jgi:hypothetical protein
MTDVYADGFAQDWAMIVGFYFVANTENYNIRVNFSFIYELRFCAEVLLDQGSLWPVCLHQMGVCKGFPFHFPGLAHQ